MSAKAQNYINGKILDIQKQELDAAVVMLVSLPENVLIETTVTDSTWWNSHICKWQKSNAAGRRVVNLSPLHVF